MLICKNCDTENADDAQICQHCKVRGSHNFVYVARRQTAFNSDPISASNGAVAACWNCSKPAGDGEKCPHCHIKLKKKEAIKPVVSKKTTGGKAIEETPQPPSTESANVKRTPRKTP